MNLEKKMGIIGCIIIIFGLWLGPSVAPGIMLGVLSTVAMGMTYYSLPFSAQKLIILFRIPIDLALAFVVPFWFGNLTATAVVGSAVNSILFSVLMEHEHISFKNKVNSKNKCNLKVI